MDVEDTWHSSLNSMIFHVVVSWTGLGEKVQLLAWNLQVCICLLYFMDANEGFSICDSEDLAKKFKKLSKLVKFYTRKKKKLQIFLLTNFVRKWNADSDSSVGSIVVVWDHSILVYNQGCGECARLSPVFFITSQDWWCKFQKLVWNIGWKFKSCKQHSQGWDSCID